MNYSDLSHKNLIGALNTDYGTVYAVYRGGMMVMDETKRDFAGCCDTQFYKEYDRLSIPEQLIPVFNDPSFITAAKLFHILGGNLEVLVGDEDHFNNSSNNYDWQAFDLMKDEYSATLREHIFPNEVNA